MLTIEPLLGCVVTYRVDDASMQSRVIPQRTSNPEGLACTHTTRIMHLKQRAF